MVARQVNCLNPGCGCSFGMYDNDTECPACGAPWSQNVEAKPTVMQRPDIKTQDIKCPCCGEKQSLRYDVVGRDWDSFSQTMNTTLSIGTICDFCQHEWIEEVSINDKPANTVSHVVPKPTEPLWLEIAKKLSNGEYYHLGTTGLLSRAGGAVLLLAHHYLERQHTLRLLDLFLQHTDGDASVEALQLFKALYRDLERWQQEKEND